MSCTSTTKSYLPVLFNELRSEPDKLKKFAESLSTHASIPLSIGLTFYGFGKPEAQFAVTASVVIFDFFMQAICKTVSVRKLSPAGISDKNWTCILKKIPTISVTAFSYYCSLAIGGGRSLSKAASITTYFVAAKFAQFISEPYSNKLKLAKGGYGRMFTRFCLTFFTVYDLKQAVDYFFNQNSDLSTEIPTTTPTTEFPSTKTILEGAVDGSDWHLDPEAPDVTDKDYPPESREGFDVYEYERQLFEQIMKEAKERNHATAQPDVLPTKNMTANTTAAEEEFFDAQEVLQT